MPLPNELIEVIALLTIESRLGRWEPEAATDWPVEWKGEAWVLPLAGLLADVEGDEPPNRALERLQQAGLPWIDARIHLKDRTLPACIVTPCTRRQAIKFGYRLGRWAVFHLDPKGFNVVYTGKNSRRD